jgi:hypothetical protein
MIRTLLPPESAHNFEITVTLDGVSFIFLFTYNTRVKRWFFRLSKSDGTVVHGDRKLVADIPLYSYLVSDDLPSGSLWSIAVSESDPGLRELGPNCYFVYIDEENVG